MASEPTAAAAPKRGRKPLAPDAPRAEPTRPYTVRLTDAEIIELQARGVRGGPGTLSHWLATQPDQAGPVKS